MKIVLIILLILLGFFIGAKYPHLLARIPVIGNL